MRGRTRRCTRRAAGWACRTRVNFNVRPRNVQLDTLQVQINLRAMQATFFRTLQSQLDVIKVLQVGCLGVTAEQVAAERAFGEFTPADGAQLPHKEAKREAQAWLLRGFLRDSIEATGLFLDECLFVCAFYEIAARGGVKGAEVNHLLHAVPKRLHRLHFPEKIATLEREYAVSTRFNAQVLSLNRARSCVVHRLAQVSNLDTGEQGTLDVTLQAMQIVARGRSTGTTQLIDRPGIAIAEESMLEMHFIHRTKSFKLGERIEFDSADLYSMIITLWRFGMAMAQSVEAHGRSKGLNFEAPKMSGREHR